MCIHTYISRNRYICGMLVHVYVCMYVQVYVYINTAYMNTGVGKHMCCRVAGLGLLRRYLFPRCLVVGHKDQKTDLPLKRQLKSIVTHSSARCYESYLTARFQSGLTCEVSESSWTAGRTGLGIRFSARKDAKPHLDILVVGNPASSVL